MNPMLPCGFFGDGRDDRGRGGENAFDAGLILVGGFEPGAERGVIAVDFPGGIAIQSGLGAFADEPGTAFLDNILPWGGIWEATGGGDAFVLFGAGFCFARAGGVAVFDDFAFGAAAFDFALWTLISA